MSDQDKPQAASTTPENASSAAETKVEATAATPQNSAANPQASDSIQESSQELSPEERVRALEAEAAAAQDRFMRAAADVQNMRRRAERDRREAEAYGGRRLALDLLPVFDNLDAALQLATDELREKEPGFFNGVELTLKELLNAFSKHKISQMDAAIGDKFDPNQHEAMYEAPTPGAEAGSVIQVMQSGFMIGDRLLRPAKVGVARAVEGDTSPTNGSGASTNANAS
ncbi:MAG: nucleotide exchange factor GrpE [Rhodobacteraceae bacterium]|nr:nucleotide exchange factor GrpE [Paracoccaceae bacterium]